MLIMCAGNKKYKFYKYIFIISQEGGTIIH